MKRIFAIAGREIRAALTSPIGYVFVLLFVLVSFGAFFYKEAFFANDQASARAFFRWMPYLLLFVCPALTMRLWADEKRLGTYEVLVTLPLKPIELVLGKFLAAFALLAGALFFTLGIPIVAELYGDLDWGPVIGGYVGALLLGAAFLSIGLVCSALVQDQILALFFGWALCALAILPDQPFWTSLLPNPGAAESLRTFGFGTHFASIERGVLDLSDLLFYLAMSGFFLYLNVSLITWRRYASGDAASGLRSRSGANLVVGAAIVMLAFLLAALAPGALWAKIVLLAAVAGWIACNFLLSDGAPRTRFGVNLWTSALLLALNVAFLAALLGRVRIGRIDLTEGNVFSLSPKTVEILDEIEDPMDVIFYYSSPKNQHEKLRPVIDPMKDVLREFGIEGDGRVNVRFLELDVAAEDERKFAEESYGVHPRPIPVRSSFSEGIQNTYFNLVVAGGGEYERYDLSQLIEIVPEGSSDIRVELADVELLVASAVRKLARGFDSVPAALVSRGKEALLTYYVSKPEALPKDVAEMPATVQKVAERIARQSGGRFVLKTIDPLEGVAPEAQEQAMVELYRRTKVRPFASFLSDATYYSTAMIEVDGQSVVLALGEDPTESGVREKVEGALKRLIPGFLTTVGIAAPQAEMNPMMMQMGQRQPPDEFAFLKQSMGLSYEVKDVTLESGVPEGVNCLVLVRPTAPSDKALYHLDQFLMRGGRLVVCADAFSMDLQRTRMTGNPEVATNDLGKLRDLLAHYGVKVGDQVLQDSRSDYVMIPQTRYIGGMPVEVFEGVDYRYLARLDGDAWDRGHDLASGLDRATLLWATPLEVAGPPAGVEAKVVASTSAESSTAASTLGLELALQSEYVPPEGARKHPVIVTLRGRFTSWFADKPIPGQDAPEAKDGEKTPEEDGEKPAAANGGEADSEKAKPAEAAAKEKQPESESLSRGAPLRESREGASLVVIGDSDFLATGTLGMLFPTREEKVWDANGALLANAVDWNGPDQDLLKIRNRPPIRRPLSGLAGMSAEEKATAGSRAATLSLALTVVAVVAVGVAWMVFRATRKPVPLLPPAALEGASS